MWLSRPHRKTLHRWDRRLISKNQDRLAGGLTSDLRPGYRSGGVVLRGIRTPSTVLHSPRPSNARPSPPDFEVWDSNGSRHADSGVLQWSPCFRREAVVQKVYATCTSTKNCSQRGLSLGLRQTPRLVPLLKPLDSVYCVSSP